MERKEMMSIIKEKNLQSDFKNKKGMSYTNASNPVLNEYLSEKGLAQTSTKSQKPSKKDEESELGDFISKVLKSEIDIHLLAFAFINLVGVLSHNNTISDEDCHQIVEMTLGYLEKGKK